jgi:hypothetical protein
LQEAVELVEKPLLDPTAWEAKIDICLITWALPQDGQVTSSITDALRSSSSNGEPQSWHTNSKIGIYTSWSFNVTGRRSIFINPCASILACSPTNLDAGT